MTLFNVVILFQYFFLVAHGVNTDNLVALIQIFRHGQRTPSQFYTNDPYKTYWGDLGPGQLTNEGRRQLYELGQLTRKRYGYWIPTKYKNNFLHAQTTDVDRTHMSGQSYLFGLFPATDDQTWLPNENWQAIPLHPADSRILYSSSNTKCSANYPLYDYVTATNQYFININENNKGMYQYITKHSGDNITVLDDLFHIYDCLQVESEVGLTLPAWSSSVFPEPLTHLAGLDTQSWTYTTQLKRFVVGTFFNEVVGYLETMVVNSAALPKMQVYSAHESNIGAILNTLGEFKRPFPIAFASTIWIELRTNFSSHYVNVWSKDGQNLTQLSINGCNVNCPLEQVRPLLSEFILDVETWTKECDSNLTSFIEIENLENRKKGEFEKLDNQKLLLK